MQIKFNFSQDLICIKITGYQQRERQERSCSPSRAKGEKSGVVSFAEVEVANCWVPFKKRFACSFWRWANGESFIAVLKRQIFPSF
jgi:hypothetical protein